MTSSKIVLGIVAAYIITGCLAWMGFVVLARWVIACLTSYAAIYGLFYFFNYSKFAKNAETGALLHENNIEVHDLREIGGVSHIGIYNKITGERYQVNRSQRSHKPAQQ